MQNWILAHVISQGKANVEALTPQKLLNTQVAQEKDRGRDREKMSKPKKMLKILPLYIEFVKT